MIEGRLLPIVKEDFTLEKQEELIHPFSNSIFLKATSETRKKLNLELNFETPKIHILPYRMSASQAGCVMFCAAQNCLRGCGTLRYTQTAGLEYPGVLSKQTSLRCIFNNCD